VIYELRVYRTLPGQMPRLLERFREHTVAIWARLGIRPVGFWITAVGLHEGTELTYMLAWDSWADRQARWAVFQADAQWRRVKSDSERAGFLIADIRNELLTPTDFSALQ
jgi:NIPSNAP